MGPTERLESAPAVEFDCRTAHHWAILSDSFVVDSVAATIHAYMEQEGIPVVSTPEAPPSKRQRMGSEDCL